MKIALLGDVALFGRFSLESNPHAASYFDSVSKYLTKFDHVVGNLETPFVGKAKPKGGKSAYIKSGVENSALLKHIGIDIVNLANNHIYDYGAAGYEVTLATLDSAGISYFGVRDRQIILNDNGAKVALLGYCSYNTNPLGASRGRSGAINALNVNSVESRLQRNRDDGLLNILSIHSGSEHVNYPSNDDIRMARQFSEICPYVYYGHHPHVIQGFECVNDALIAYSLGNFCFDDVYTSKSSEPLVKQSLNNRAGLIFELEIVGNEVISHKLTPMFLGEDGVEVGSEEIANQLVSYSNALKDPSDLYLARRSALLRTYLEGRKDMRDLTWYVKRLNLNSVEMLLRARLNGHLYRKNVSSLLRAD